MNEIMLGGKCYGIDGDHYEGDLLLIGEQDTGIIAGGYERLRQQATAALFKSDSMRWLSPLDCSGLSFSTG
jgi:hypothetical protein